MSDETEVDFADFEAQVDRVVEAAANRDAETDEIDRRYYAYLAKIGERKAELSAELSQLAQRENTAARVRNQQRVAAANRFTEATEGLSDEPPF